MYLQAFFQNTTLSIIPTHVECIAAIGHAMWEVFLAGVGFLASAPEQTTIWGPILLNASQAQCYSRPVSTDLSPHEVFSPFKGVEHIY